jgi:hypothetical protein
MIKAHSPAQFSQPTFVPRLMLFRSKHLFHQGSDEESSKELTQEMKDHLPWVMTITMSLIPPNSQIEVVTELEKYLEALLDRSQDDHKFKDSWLAVSSPDFELQRMLLVLPAFGISRFLNRMLEKLPDVVCGLRQPGSQLLLLTTGINTGVWTPDNCTHPPDLEVLRILQEHGSDLNGAVGGTFFERKYPSPWSWLIHRLECNERIRDSHMEEQFKDFGPNEF